jgi:hypothetical protein
LSLENVVLGYVLSLTLLSLAFVAGWRLGGARYAIGQATLLSFLIPTWLILPVFGLPIDVRLVSAIVCLLTVLFKRTVFFRRGLLPHGLVGADFCMAAVLVIHCLSDWLAGTSPIIVPFRAYGEWLIPYFLGRFCVMELGDLRPLSSVALWVLLILGLLCAIEAITGVNLFETLAGNRPLDLSAREAARFGLKRAYGPTIHPIFLGLLLMLLMPWLSLLWLLPLRWFQHAAVAGTAAISSISLLWTGSRMVIAGALASVATASFCLLPRYRWPLGIGLVLATVGGWWFAEPIIETVMRASGESRALVYQTVQIDGQALPYSSAMSRLYAFRLYRPALMRAGLFGFGTERCTGFPIRVPLAPGNAAALDVMPTVENTYLLLALRLGWLGVTAFVAALSCFIYNALRAAIRIHAAAERSFSAWMCGSLVGVAIVCTTVWMPHDFGFVLLWTGGAVTSLRLAVDRKSQPRQALPSSDLNTLSVV